MKPIKNVLIASAILGLGGTLAHAEPYNSSWYLMPSASMLFPDSDLNDENNGEGLGIRIGKPISEHWDVQLGATYARAREHGVKFDQATYGVDMLYLFSRGRFRPFLLVGGGAERDDVWGRGLNMDKTSPFVEAGLGFQYQWSDRWFTQLDARRVHGFMRGHAFDNETSDNDYLTLGVSYSFGVPQQVARAEPERPQAAPPVETVARPAARLETYTLSSTELFAFDRADLAGEQPRLDEIAAALNSNPDIDDVVILGYTDRLGSDAYNMELSVRRVEAVKSYLVQKGVAAGRLSAEGKGEQNPVVQCSETNRAALIKCLEPNRRVEVQQITIERRTN